MTVPQVCTADFLRTLRITLSVNPCVFDTSRFVTQGEVNVVKSGLYFFDSQ